MMNVVDYVDPSEISGVRPISSNTQPTKTDAGSWGKYLISALLEELWLELEIHNHQWSDELQGRFTRALNSVAPTFPPTPIYVKTWDGEWPAKGTPGYNWITPIQKNRIPDQSYQERQLSLRVKELQEKVRSLEASKTSEELVRKLMDEHDEVIILHPGGYRAKQSIWGRIKIYMKRLMDPRGDNYDT